MAKYYDVSEVTDFPNSDFMEILTRIITACCKGKEVTLRVVVSSPVNIYSEK